MSLTFNFVSELWAFQCLRSSRLPGKSGAPIRPRVSKARMPSLQMRHLATERINTREVNLFEFEYFRLILFFCALER